MNRKLHNSVTALVATSGLLVLSLMAANPVSTAAHAVIAPVVVQAPATPAPSAKAGKLVVDARHAAEAAARIEARAAELQARLDATKHPSEAVGEIVGFVAEAATLASIAAAMDGIEATDAVADQETATPPARKRTHGRQSVSMPFYSFAPRG